MFDKSGGSAQHIISQSPIANYPPALYYSFKNQNLEASEPGKRGHFHQRLCSLQPVIRSDISSNPFSTAWCLQKWAGLTRGRAVYLPQKSHISRRDNIIFQNISLSEIDRINHGGKVETKMQMQVKS